MIDLQSLNLSNIVYFKGDTTFEFQKGVTFIQGRNLQRRGQTASNGSGKSLLFGALPNLILDSHPTITKNVRSVQKQMYGKDSAAELIFRDRKTVWGYKKTGSKVFVSKDGQDTTSRVGRDHIKKLLPFSEKEFYSTVYLDSRRPNTFLMGTSAERFDFITEVFRLQDIDEFRRHVNRHITDLSSDNRVLEQTSADIENLRLRLKALPKTAAAEAKELNLWLSKATTRVQRMTALQHQWDNYRRYEKALKNLEELPVSKHTVKEIRATLSELDGYDAQLRQWKRQQRERESLQEEFDKLKDIDDSDFDAMQKRKARLVAVEQPDEPQGDVEKARKLAAKMDRKTVEAAMQKARAKRDMLQEQLDTFNSEVGEADVCPTCHSELSAKTKAAIRSNFEEQIATLNTKLENAQRCIKAHKLVAEFDAYEVEKKAYDAYVKEAKALKAYPFADIRRKRELAIMLTANAVKKPKPPTTLIFGNDREKLEDALTQAQERAKLVSLAESLKTDMPDQEVDDAKIEALNKEVVEKMAQLPELQAMASERKTAITSLTELKERQGGLQAGLDDLPVYKMLSEAYSAKGIKVLMVRQIAKHIEKNLNRHARQVFAEDFRFSLVVEDSGQFGVNVTRHANRKTTTSDVRMMSGAESRLFIYLFVLALLPLLPSNRRLNTLLLDEPDANMDPETREVFRDNLVPKLAKIVPCLIVISPNQDIVPQHARVYTVVKDKGVSRLVKGLVK